MQPDLQGKLVLEFTISPAGEVTECHVVSSELKDPDLEQQDRRAREAVPLRGQGRGYDHHHQADRVRTHDLIGELVNLQSEIEYFSDLQPVDQARLLAVFLHELAVEARSTYGAGAEQVHDAARVCASSTRSSAAWRASSSSCWPTITTRPADDVVMRMLLSPRADQAAERLVMNAYRRAMHGFDRYDATVAMDK